MGNKSGLGTGLDALFSHNTSNVSPVFPLESNVKKKDVNKDVDKNINENKEQIANIISSKTKKSSNNRKNEIYNFDDNSNSDKFNVVENLATQSSDFEKFEESLYNNSPFRVVNINEIEPNKNQPRKDFNLETLNELADSIKEYGVIQPLVVSKKDSYYSIVAGERRWRACKIAGITQVPVILRDDDEAMNSQIALIENLQREDLNIVEKANGISSLINSYNLTHQQVAQKLGKARSSITNILRVLNLDPRVLEHAKSGELTENQCKMLLEYEDSDEQYLACMAIINNKPSIKNKHGKKEEMDPQTRILYNQIEDQFEMFFGSKVKLTPGKRKGKIIIEYSSNDDLERILGLIN